MANYYRTFMNTVWSEHIWLPPNTTWADIAPNASMEIQHTDYRDLLYPLPMALVMLALRYLLEKYWFGPVGLSLGIKNTRPKKASDNPILEKAFAQSKKWKHKQIQGLAKQLDISERQVERWLRYRKGQNKPSTLTKFCENSWRCLYYTFSFIYGITILWDKTWLNGFPHQSITSDIWWYYMISMSFYWSLCVSQFFDVKRKDFWQMFVHHIATILLMCLSWTVNVFRIGTLVFAAKMAKYSGYQKICDVIYAVFTVLWIFTRLGIYPFWIIKNTSIDAPKIVPMFPAYYIFNSLLILLLVLHCFWTYLILKIAYNSLNAGKMEGDIRSSSDDYSEETNHDE
ncbi:hypothetical protein NQ317_006274 [Molorchus minor]|uniref:Ceramide synthase 6 n=1 Tax=Molorchus minor TaxID=1323400 RepID=A0ABQ9J428_9CUCU|nr:hypothetical protein NQ317_006274 [Molorchus minor]